MLTEYAAYLNISVQKNWLSCMNFSAFKMKMFVRCFSGTVRAAQQDLLKKYYSPELLKSISLADKVIPDNVEFKHQTNVEFSPPYMDNFATLHPYWDYKPNTPNLHSSSSSSFVAEFEQHPDLTPPVGSYLQTDGKSDLQNIATGIQLQTGFNAEHITKKLTMKPLILKMVSNQTAKGKIPSFYSLVVVGDKNGMVGIGEGKSREDMAESVKKAHWDAVRNLREIPRFENRTIFGDIDYRYHGVKLFLRAAKPGFGLRVNHVIYEICECAGIKDLSAKVYKSRNLMNIAKGTLEALTGSQKSLDEIALGRGKKVVDIKKIYYSA